VVQRISPDRFYLPWGRFMRQDSERLSRYSALEHSKTGPNFALMKRFSLVPSQLTLNSLWVAALLLAGIGGRRPDWIDPDSAEGE